MISKGTSLLFRSLAFSGLLLLSVVFLISGCATASSVRNENETTEEAQSALSAVAGALSGKTLSEEDLRNLEKQIKEDEEAQTAIQVITESVGGKAHVVKYCPVTGRRYAPHMEQCPEHQVHLEIVDP